MRTLLAQDEFLEALKRSPAGEKIAEAAAREQLASRRELAEQLSAQEPSAEAENLLLWAKRDAAREAIRAAERALIEARQAYWRADADCSQASYAQENRRNVLIRALRESSHPAIAAFHLEMRDLLDKARAALDVTSERKINPITGLAEVRSASNRASIADRVSAIHAAQDAADVLGLLADQREVPSRLDELRAALPPIEKAVLI